MYFQNKHKDYIRLIIYTKLHQHMNQYGSNDIKYL